jgi:hypothetical protein
MSFSDFLEDKVLKYILKKVPFVKPDLDLALGIAAAADDTPPDWGGEVPRFLDPANNVDPTGYSRKPITFDNVSSDAPTRTSAISNDQIISFDEATENWGRVQYFAIFERGGGNMLAYGTFDAFVDVDEGDQLDIQVGDITIKLQSTYWSQYLQEGVLDHVFGPGSFSVPDTYLALCFHAPDFEGISFHEPVGNNAYQRLLVLPARWTCNAALGEARNNQDIASPQATADWGTTIDTFALYDTANSGHFLCHGDFSQGSQIAKGNNAFIAANALTISLS